MKNQKRKLNRWILVVTTILVGAVVLSACNMPSPTESIDEAVQHAMETLQAQATQDAFQTMVAPFTQTATPLAPTATASQPVVPTNTPIPPTNTPIPTVVVTVVPPTATSVPPTATRIPPTPTPLPCNWVEFVKDVTIPDGTKITGGTSFTKTWRLRNAGSCTWTTEYDLAFVKGDQMSAPNYVDMPKAVKPGETIDLSVDMIAPSAPGKYTAYFMLVNQNGVRFGTGSDAKGAFWVNIEVTQAKNVFYHFASEACKASWSSGTSGSLSCPGRTRDIASGYVIPQAWPIREDGAKEDEPGLITRPDNTAAGFITGYYPFIAIKNGDRFKATVMCEGGMTKCDIYFTVQYRVGSDPVQTLGQWHEVNEGMWTRVDIDLSALDGKNVQFILTVNNGADSSQNSGLWLNPIIYRP